MIRADSDAFEADRADYLAQLIAPMDDMWAAFADASSHYGLWVDAERVGSCAVDAEGRLLRFHVSDAESSDAAEVLRTVLTSLPVGRVIAGTMDPRFLRVALELASRVEPHTLLYEAVEDPTAGELRAVPGVADDAERIVDFQHAAIGAPREFLDGYVRDRLASDEMLLHEDAGELVSVGELRIDRHQPGIAHLGIVVGDARRGGGIGSRMLSTLVRRTRERGLRPHCSTEVGNVGAQRAIERSGFRPTHQLLQLEPRPRGS